MALPVCILMAFAFRRRRDGAHDVHAVVGRLRVRAAVTLPLFLFSATFYPLSSYGDWGWVVQLSPLYHGVALVRGVQPRRASWAYLYHVGRARRARRSRRPSRAGVPDREAALEVVAADLAWTACCSGRRPRWWPRAMRCPARTDQTMPVPDDALRQRQPVARSVARAVSRPRCSGWGASGAPSGSSGRPRACTRPSSATPGASRRTRRMKRCARAAPATPRSWSWSTTRRW